jgi:hypothetical protein
MPEPIEVTPYEMLKILIAAKCDQSKPDPVDTAVWLLTEKPGLLRLLLEQLIEEAAQQRADDEGAQDMLEIRPSLRAVDDEMRVVAETLGVQRRYLYSRTTEQMEHACRLAEEIFKLHADEDAAMNAALERLQDELRPALAGCDTRDMTIGEARAELERRTAETIRGLETDFEKENL